MQHWWKSTTTNCKLYEYKPWQELGKYKKSVYVYIKRLWKLGNGWVITSLNFVLHMTCAKCWFSKYLTVKEAPRVRWYWRFIRTGLLLQRVADSRARKVDFAYLPAGFGWHRYQLFRVLIVVFLLYCVFHKIYSFHMHFCWVHNNYSTPMFFGVPAWRQLQVVAYSNSMYISYLFVRP